MNRSPIDPSSKLVPVYVQEERVGVRVGVCVCEMGREDEEALHYFCLGPNATRVDTSNSDLKW